MSDEKKLPRFPFAIGKPLVEEGGYSILRAEDGGYWIENPLGEGCHMSAEVFGKVLEDWFRENF